MTQENVTSAWNFLFFSKLEKSRVRTGFLIGRFKSRFLYEYGLQNDQFTGRNLYK